MKVPPIAGEIEIDLTEIVEEDPPDQGLSGKEFEKLMEASGPQEPHVPAETADVPPACKCCNRTDRRLWDEVCAWCCP